MDQQIIRKAKLTYILSWTYVVVGDSHRHFQKWWWHGFTDVSRARRFPERRFPDKTFLGQDLSRTIIFPDRRFPDKLGLYYGIFMYIMCVNTSSIGLVTRYVGIRGVY